MLDCKSCPSHGRTPCVHIMCGGATSTSNDHFLTIKTHKKNNLVQISSCLDEQMKAHIIEVQMAIMGSPILPKTKCLWLWHKWCIWRWCLGFGLTWKSFLTHKGGNVHVYQLDIFVEEANPSAPLENPPAPTTIPLICRTQPWVFPTFSLVTSPIIFQPIPPISIIPQLITFNSYFTQDPSFGISGCIIQRPWEQNPLQSMINMDDPMDGEQLDVVIQMTSYMPFDTTKGKGVGIGC